MAHEQHDKAIDDRQMEQSYMPDMSGRQTQAQTKMTKATFMPNKVLLDPLVIEKSPGGLHLTGMSYLQSNFHRVLDLGPRRDAKGKPIEWEIKKGDQVLCESIHGVNIELAENGKALKLVDISEIQAVIGV